MDRAFRFHLGFLHPKLPTHKLSEHDDDEERDDHHDAESREFDVLAVLPKLPDND
jgi:hypothetical protein